MSTLKLPKGTEPRLVTYRPGLGVRHFWAGERRGMRLEFHARLTGPRSGSVVAWALGEPTVVSEWTGDYISVG